MRGGGVAGLLAMNSVEGGVPEAQSIALFQEIQEEVPCPLCAANAPLPDLVVRDRLFWRPGEYNIVRCSACSMRYLSPRPALAELAAHYPDNYFIYKKAEDVAAWMRPLLQRVSDVLCMRDLRRIEKVVGTLTPATQVLDVGCGMANLLSIAKKRRGCVGTGVEFKAEVAAYVRDVRKLPCIHGTLHDGRFADASFDLVTMNEYLEHEPMPRAVLQEARRITKPGGHISIEVPYSDSLPARLFGSRWAQIDAPRHLVHFTKKTLADMLGRSGYEIIHLKTFEIPLMVGFSATQLLIKQIGGPTALDMGLALLASLPFYLFYPWMHEFIHVVARAV
jgi:SAM-dependent methyltransferase